MKQYNRRKEQMVEVSEPFMNELFFHSCMELQKTFEKIGHQEWDGLEKGLKEVLAIGKRMQEEEDKGKIHYVIFSFLRYAPRGRELGIKIDLLNRNFYLDEQECEGFFYPDILCQPCLFLSKTSLEVPVMYGVDVSYKVVKLSDWENGANATYFLPIIEEVDCMSEETIYNRTGNRIEQLVLEKEKIGNRVAFRVKGYKRNGFISRLDYVESILRRGVEGIRFEEIWLR